MRLAGGEGSLANDGTMGVDLLRVGLGTAMILLVPLVSMQLTGEVAWTGVDFAVAAVLLAGAGFTCIRAARRAARLRRWQQVATVGALALVFAAVWVELAVGVFFSFGS